jgi:hypothetical protein
MDPLIMVKATVNLSLCFYWSPRHEGVLGSGGIAPRILDLGTRWRWVISFTPPPLYPQGKSPWYPLDRRMGGLQSRSVHRRKEKNSEPPPGLEPSINQPVTLNVRSYTPYLEATSPIHKLRTRLRSDVGCSQRPSLLSNWYRGGGVSPCRWSWPFTFI